MVHALKGKEHVEWENPYDCGMTGLTGFSSGYHEMHDCDVLPMLGTDFPDRLFYPQGSGVRIARVDLRASQIGRRASVDLTELAMPPAVTLEMAKGFSLYMVKAVMNGRGDEIADLAKSNLWR